MTAQKKINLLVVPDLFPKYKNDVQGIFLLDYLKCTVSFCNNTVLFGRLSGDKPGITNEEMPDAHVVRFIVSDHPVSGFRKFLAYRKWFRLGLQASKQITHIDLVHSHGSILSGTLGRIIAKRKKIPFVLTEHVGPFSTVTKSFWKKRWTKFIMEKADLVLCVSEHQKNEILAAGINPKRIEVTYNPVDTELFHLPPAKRTSHNFLFAGRLDNFKGALRCVKAFALLADKYLPWTFTIVGDGEDENPIKEFIRANPQLNERVILRGRKTKAEIAEEMHKADFFVFPSIHESFGLVIAEALSCGRPVITTNRTAPKEFVVNDFGIFVDPESLQEISLAMEKMTASHATYNPELIRRSVTERFSFEKFGKKLQALYASVSA